MLVSRASKLVDCDRRLTIIDSLHRNLDPTGQPADIGSVSQVRSDPEVEFVRSYVACSIGKVDPDAAMKTIWFYLAALILGLIAIALIPAISIAVI